MTVSFVRLGHLNDGRFCSFVPWWVFKNCRFFFCYESVMMVEIYRKKNTKFQWWSVLLGYKISLIVGFVSLYLYQISKVVGYFPLWDFKDGRLGNEISKTVSFVLLQDFKDGRFCFVMRFQWRLVLFSYGISLTVGFVLLFLHKISKTVGFVPYDISKMVNFCSKFTKF